MASEHLVRNYLVTDYPYSDAISFYFSIGVGTFVGLLTKYVLDKKFIFKFQVKNLNQDTKTFIVYASMGLITTLIFLGFELGFDYFFKTKTMRYTGATLGLMIGYWVKYKLDKRFVFIDRVSS